MGLHWGRRRRQGLHRYIASSDFMGFVRALTLTVIVACDTDLIQGL